MQKKLWLAMLLAGVFAVSACSKAKDDAKPATDETTKTETGEVSKDVTAPLTPEAIADALSRAVCSRMVACNQNAGVTEADCAAGMTKDLSQALPEPARTVEKDVLDSCIESIKKASCEDLNSPTPPAGCEFMG